MTINRSAEGSRVPFSAMLCPLPHAKVSFTTSGGFLAIRIRVCAAPDGDRRPCSHSWSVRFDRQIVVRQAKGAKDRRTLLPQAVIEPLKVHLLRVKAWHEKDLANGYGAVELPNALDLKYPSAGRKWGWQFVFPSYKLSVDPRSGLIRRHHVYENFLIRGVKHAVFASGIAKQVSCHTLTFVRHSLVGEWL